MTCGKPNWLLLKESAEGLTRAGHTPFTRVQLRAGVQQEHPDKENDSLNPIIQGITVNLQGGAPSGVGRNILYSIARGVFELYDQEKHGSTPPGITQEAGCPSHDEFEQPEFALEKHLEEFIYHNWSHIDFGRPLALFRDGSGRDGRQWHTGQIGSIDFLCQDETDGSFTVIELKKGRPTDRVIGQLQRYMGWVSENLSDAAEVRGIIISPAISDLHLQYALRATKNIEWKCYEFTFRLTDPPTEP